MSQYFPHLTLASLSVLGYFGLHHLGHNDGLFPQLEQVSKTYPIPTSNESLKGLGGVLVGFFYPTISGEHPGLTLACYLFVGQALSLWTVIMLEGNRAGNRWRIISFTTLFGVAMQLVGGAVVIPLYFLVHLLTSPTTTTSSTSTSKQTLAIPPQTQLATPLALLLGLGIPTVLMSLPSPSILSYQQRINAILLWQAFPIWTNALQFVLSYILPTPSPSFSSSSSTTHHHHHLLLRCLYLPPIILSALAHISALTLALTPLLAPSAFSATTAQQWPAAILGLPPNPFAEVKAQSVAEGALWFIQYDYAVCGWAFLLWAAVVAGGRKVGQRAREGRNSADSGWDGIGGWVWKGMEVLGKAVVLGPLAAGALLVWERDEAVLDEDDRREGKKKV
jgi:hypothetical protein